MFLILFYNARMWFLHCSQGRYALGICKFCLPRYSLPHTRATCWANRLARQPAQLCIFTARVGKTTQQQHNWQNHLHFPPFCSKSHEETMVCHWLIDSNSSALSLQHPQPLRFFPREAKNIKHDRYFPQGLERSYSHENYPHTRATCWASCLARRLAQQVALVCGGLKAMRKQACFIHRIFVASNAIKTIDNEMTIDIIIHLVCILVPDWSESTE
jgi:hypothetical protein